MIVVTYIKDLLDRVGLIAKAVGAVLNGLSTGAAVPARDVAAVLILGPLAVWILAISFARPARPKRIRRAARR